MTTENPQYRAIVDVCRKSQEIMDRRLTELGLPEAVAELAPYQSMWEKCRDLLGGPADLRNADFTGLLFKWARFEHARFLECDFSGSRWIFSFIKSGNCAGSDFSGMRAVLDPFQDTDCSNCDFSNAVINSFNPFGNNNCAGARFVGATLETSDSFFNAEKLALRTKFDDAVMDGCRLIIKKEERPENRRPRKEVESVLRSLFSPDQMAVMKIDNGSSACFIATASCGARSSEVMALRRFRDTRLLNSALGRLLVGAYCRVSPPLASLIEGSPRTRRLVRSMLVRPVARLVDRKNP